MPQQAAEPLSPKAGLLVEAHDLLFQGGGSPLRAAVGLAAAVG